MKVKVENRFRKKAIFMVLAVTMLVVAVFALTGCSNELKNYHSEGAFDQLKGEDAARTNGSNIRVMSANVLVHIKSGWGGTPVAPRAQSFGEVVGHYLPDVVGLQEFCACWYKELPRRLPQYKLLDTKKSQYTTIMYNSETVKLLEQGVVRYSKQANKRCRLVVWGVFERLVGGEKFAVTSTHWDFGDDDKKVIMRDTQVSELSSIVDELSKKEGGIPVFAVGDYNAFEKKINEGAKWYADFISKAGVVDAKFVEGITRRPIPTVNYEEESWDHIFIKGQVLINAGDKSSGEITRGTASVEALGFGVLFNDFYEAISDHSPIYLDAKI